MPMPTSFKPLSVRVARLGDESMMRRGELVRMAHASSTTTTEDDGFPPGTDGCDCGHCFQGVTIPDASGTNKCCMSHLQWSLINPWLECADTDLTLEYAGDADGWLTEPFDGPDCGGFQNEYRWQLTIDVTGRSYLTLVRENDNGCPDVCIVYGRDSFECQCDNTFSLLKPYGTWIGVERDQLSCYACLKPVVSNIGEPGKHCGDDTDYAAGYYIDLGTVEDSGGPSTCTNCDCLSGIWLATVNPTPWHNTSSGCSLTGCGGSPQAVESISVLCPGTNMGANGYFVVDIEIDAGPLARWRCLPEDFDPFGTSTFELYYDGGDCAVPSTIEVIAVPASGGGLPPSETGVCDETCEPPPAPVDPDAGACCFEGVLYDYWTEALCDDFGGEWCPDADDCDCESEVACCIAGSCIMIDAFACNFLAGTPSGDSCDPNPCGGACCESDGSCNFTDQATCEGGGGFYHGDGTDCGDYDCNMTACCSGPPIPPGNCACTDQTWAACSGGTEVALGRGTTCADPEGYTCTNYPGVDCGWQPP